MNNLGLKATIVMMVLMLSSLGAMVLNVQDAGAAGPPSRAIYRYFSGKITNLDANTVGNFNDTKNVTASGMDSNNKVVGPFFTTKQDWDPVTFYFTLEVDIQTHDSLKPWIISIADRYGWNRSGDQAVNPSVDWYDGTTPIYDFAPDTLSYNPGVLGDLKFTVINGSSMAPLPGVGFSFDKHTLYNTVWNISGALERGNLTDANGDVLFQNMQLGRDLNNNVKVRFLKEHFTTADKTGVGYFPLFRDVQTNYQVTLVEDPLVYQYSPGNGAVDVETNKTRVKSSLFVRFFGPMDRTSVDMDTIYLEKEGGSKVPVTYEWDVTDSYVTLQPAYDLDYNTQYSLVVTPRVHNKTGVEPLWRTFTTTFITHKRPAIIRGTIGLKGTVDPAPEGSMVRLNNFPPVLLVDGAFNFSSVLPSTEGYNVTALGPTVGEEQQYLYFGNWKAGIMANRGDIIDVTGLYVEKRPTRTVIFKVMDESGKMLEGVSVTHLVTGDVVLTDTSGMAVMEDILKERTTRFRLSLENYYTVTSYPVPAGWENTALVNVTLVENEFPLTVKAWTDSAQVLDPTALTNIISAEAYFKLEFDDDGTRINMDPETMTTDNLKLLQAGTASVALDIEHDAGDMSVWSMKPRSELNFATNYTLIIKEAVADQYGNNPLWRDYSINLRTSGLDPASINGKVTIRDRGVEGIPVSAYVGETLLKRTYSGPNGFYILDIVLTQREITGVRVEVDGSAYGLSSMNLSGLTLRASGSLNNTDFALSRLAGWFTVIYPKDHMGLLEIDGSITLGFKNPLSAPDMETFVENFTMRGVSDLGITLSADKRSVILDPVGELDYDRAYEVSVSYYPDGESQRELLFLSGAPALLGGERLLINTTFKPIDVILSVPGRNYNVSRTDKLVLYFTNYSIDASKLEPALELKKALDTAPMTNLTLTWDQNQRTLDIGHPIFDIKTEYELSIPKGVYGVNGAMIRNDFLFTFVTEETKLDQSERPMLTIPGKVDEGKKLTLQATNNVARALSMMVEIRRNDQTSGWEMLENFTLNPLEEDKVISLDLGGLKKGEYQLRVRAIDPTSGAILDEQVLNFQVTEEGSSPPTVLIWIWIVIAVIIVIIVVLGVYLFTQSKKKDIETELKEEFECPECHSVVSADDSVCPHCGAEFEESAYKCPKCGAMLDHESEECSECGYDFSDQEKMEVDDEDEEEEEEGEDISEMYEEDEEEDEEDIEELEEDEDEEEEDEEDED